MNIYEKENAKEWELNTSNKPKPNPSDEKSDSESEYGGAAPVVGASQNRFAPISSTALEPRANVGPTTWSPKRRERPPAREGTPGHGKSIARGPRPATQNLQRTLPTQVATTQFDRSKIPAKAAITFSNKNDNASKAAYRKGKLHDATFTLDKTCEKIEPDRARMYTRLEEIGVRFGSFIRPPQKLHDRIMQLWGNEKQIAETICELKSWMSQSEEDEPGMLEKIVTKAGHEKFGKVGELQKNREDALDRRIRRGAEMQAYQKDPVDGQQFEFQGYFLWPSNEAKPEDLLGANCEAFDPIRTYNHSHIVFEPQISCFKILSNKEAAMQNAIERIEGTMREFAARSSTTYAFNLVQPPEASSLCEEVKTLPGPPLSDNAKASRIPVLTGKRLTNNALAARQAEMEDLEAGNKKRIQRSLRKVLERLPHFRGRLRMRVHFGTFILDTIRWPGGAPTISFAEFISSITNTATTTGVVLRDLQCQGNFQALVGRCASSRGSFEPTYVTRDEDVRVIPIHTGRFIFRTPNGNVTLEVELKKPLDEKAIYEVSRTQWTKNDQVALGSPFDVNVVQLTGGCSWRLHLAHTVSMDDTHITPRMADFASSVRYKAPPSGTYPEVAGCKVFKHAFNMQYESFEQKTAVQFHHKYHGSWIFEFARYDAFSPNINTASSKTQWGASFWNTEWDNILAANENLGIGQAAPWEPKLDRFFPADNQAEKRGKDGFQSFLDDVKDISDMLDEMKHLP